MKKKIKQVVIIFRKNTKNTKPLAAELSSWLIKKKIKVFSHPEQFISPDVPILKTNKKVSNIDLIVVLGGDGTYLEAVRFTKGNNVPILGVNLGSLGFLTETREEDLYKALTLTLQGKMEKRPRSILNICIRQKGKMKKSFIALNDLVIEKGARSHLINLNISFDKLNVSDLKADGVIIASPTGSTAYNLAAHGPILHPEVNAFVVTPICPHSLTSRPILFPDHKKLSFKLNDRHQKATLTIDGQTQGELSDKDTVTVERASWNHYVLRQKSHNYFYVLREKLKFGERA